MTRHHILFIVRYRSVETELSPDLIQHYDVITVQARRDALHHVTEGQVDLILIHLPSLRFDVTRFCDDLAAWDIKAPLFFLLGKGMRLDQLPHADGYLRQPFTARQLLRRLARTLPEHRGEIVAWRELKLDTETNVLMWESKQVPLTPKQAALAAIFLRDPGEICSRARLMQEVWGTNYLGDTRTLDVHIHWLRKSLTRLQAPFVLKTVRGKGYYFIAQDSKQERP